jgi:hypothetical protein
LFGAPPEVVAELQEHGAAEEFDVLPENWPTVMMWLRVQTQWRVAGLGGAIGLDYTAVEAAMRMLRVPNRAEVFDGLQVMELAALEAMKD